MPVPAAATCYSEWIHNPQVLLSMLTKMGGNVIPTLKNVRPNEALQAAARLGVPSALHATLQRAIEGKITLKARTSHDIHTDAGEIKATLKACSADEQYARDVAMWYGYCNKDSKGAKMCLRLFSLMKQHGVLYRKPDKTWGDFAADYGDVPLASLLSHGGRVLFLLPQSDSRAVVAGSTVKAVGKALFVSPVTKLVSNKSAQTTYNFKGTRQLVPALKHVFGPALSVATVGHKAYAAGDDRIWQWIVDEGWFNNTVHQRAMASHSVDKADNPEPLKIEKNRRLWYVEVKPGGKRNFNESGMGLHHYKNVALGGIGEMNPYSGVKVDKDGTHGHLYMHYWAPRVGDYGTLLVGCEGSAPGRDNQCAQSHTDKAEKGEFSATGGQKWPSLVPGKFFDPKKEHKHDCTTFVCDLSHLSIAEVIGTAQIKVNSLSAPVYKVMRLEKDPWTGI